MAANAQAAPAPPEAQGQAQQVGIGQMINMVARFGLMYAFMMWMRSGSSGGESSTPTPFGVDPVGECHSWMTIKSPVYSNLMCRWS